MNKRSKYYPLFEYLNLSSDQTEVFLTFAQIELLLNATLPLSATTSQVWWSNRSEGALQAASWMEAGYYVAELNLEKAYVKFRKLSSRYEVQTVNEAKGWSGELVKALRLYMNITQSQLAEELGVRQQTISDWEHGIHVPSRAVSKLLTEIAKRVGFRPIGNS